MKLFWETIAVIDALLLQEPYFISYYLATFSPVKVPVQEM